MPVWGQWVNRSGIGRARFRRVTVSPPLARRTSGLSAFWAWLCRRLADGRGRHVETSLMDGALAYLSMMWGDTDDGEPAPVVGTEQLVAATFRCADGETWACIPAPSVPSGG